MSKIDDYDLKGVPQQLIDFKDDIRDLLNNGKYQFSVVTGTPVYRAGSGELSLYFGAVGVANASAMYVRTGSNFSLVAKFTNAG